MRHAATDKLQDGLCDVGKLMIREKFPIEMRMLVAQSFYDVITETNFKEMSRNHVFLAFFAEDEEDEMYRIIQDVLSMP